MKKILILHTGGTIAMSQDESGGVSTTSTNPLMNLHVSATDEVELIVEDILNVPSPHITPQHMLLIKNRIEKAVKEQFNAVVVTHGTDTLEETAYFLDITVGDLLPIVLTGAMRSSNEIGADGLYNFQSAIKVAMSDEAIGKGTLVVMNDEIHTARFVTKTHTTNVATFRTPTFGPIGLIAKDSVRFYQELIRHETLPVNQVDGLIPIIKAYAGMGDTLTLFTQTKIDGIVIEALGAGNLPPKTMPSINKLLENNIPIVLVSRCFNGVTSGVYDYEGGGRQLQRKGVMFCDGINSQKARLKLLVALNASLKDDELYQFITQ
ncbi:asparaginase [Vagococcus xieshaowenii]|uniref:asparaginase n=1 Tax=Vagococcus xieshaowenii TaxID=2562451 RepID=A0AAJ5EFQ1_9ENTE|nr:asparaginase [Vagococcus xieshaowenii]QCA28042.1 asparaginase [Vagococcus xieshaowenii]TFZ42102.1 asparaginase [Vagococcus xieshaowenii]